MADLSCDVPTFYCDTQAECKGMLEWIKKTDTLYDPVQTQGPQALQLQGIPNVKWWFQFLSCNGKMSQYEKPWDDGDPTGSYRRVSTQCSSGQPVSPLVVA
jgi:hypothetical protein